MGKKIRKNVSIFFFLLVVLLPLRSQGIKGEIVDVNGEPVPYAAIFIKQLTRGTTCNALGMFSLPLPEGKLAELLEHMAPQVRRVIAMSTDIDVMSDVRAELNDTKISAAVVLDGRQTLDLVPTIRPEAATAVGKGGDQAELRTIDSFGFSNVSLIKIDVEGYEGHVLDGSEKTIRTWRPAIIIEIKGGEHDLDKVPPKDRKHVSMVLGRLETWGYTAKRTVIDWNDYLAVPEDNADPGGPPR